MCDPTVSIDGGQRHAHDRPGASAHGWRRRRLLTASAAFTGAGPTTAVMPEFGQQPAARATMRPTSGQGIGPPYPLRLPLDRDADLTVIAGKDARALATIVYSSGRVTNVRGEPVANADLEIWQANAAGRYTHAADHNPQPIDSNFDGCARVRADAEGRYRIKNVEPGACPVTLVPGWLRPPHTHFDVRGQAGPSVPRPSLAFDDYLHALVEEMETYGKPVAYRCNGARASTAHASCTGRSRCRPATT